ncbi:unnamed protein product [Lampetra planeri]
MNDADISKDAAVFCALTFIYSDRVRRATCTTYGTFAPRLPSNVEVQQYVRVFVYSFAPYLPTTEQPSRRTENGTEYLCAAFADLFPSVVRHDVRRFAFDALAASSGREASG